MGIEKNKRMAIQFIESLGRVDPSQLGEYDLLLHPDYNPEPSKSYLAVWSDVVGGIGDVPGIEAFKTRLVSYTEQLKNVKIKIIDVAGEANIVFIHYLLQFDHNKDFLGYPATGLHINLETVHKFVFKDGKIYRLFLLQDYYRLLTEIGASLVKEDDEMKIQKYLENLKANNILPA